MYRKSKFVEGFEFVKCTISWKFNGKLWIIEVQKTGFVEKFEFVECTKLWKFNENLCTLDVWEVRIRWMYDIEKIQRKIVH